MTKVKTYKLKIIWKPKAAKDLFVLGKKQALAAAMVISASHFLGWCPDIICCTMIAVMVWCTMIAWCTILA